MTSSSLCPDVGTWRAWLDDEAADATALTAHAQACAHCQAVVDDLRRSASLVASRIGALWTEALPSPLDVASARARVDVANVRSIDGPRPAGHASDRSQRVPVVVGRASAGWRAAFGGLAAAVILLVGLAFTPGGQSAASAFLAQFRTRSVAPIAISAQSQADLTRTMSALGRMGTVSLPGGATGSAAAARDAARQAQTVTLAEAARTVSPLLRPDPRTLPPTLQAPPKVQVMPAQSIQFTFEKAKASAYFASIGRSDFVVPDRFDGATLGVTIPTAVLLQYGDAGSKEALVVGQSGEVTVDMVGGQVGLDEMRVFLLSLPGLPADVVRQLNNLNDWSNTLPVPIPVDVVTWKQVTIGGNPGGLLLDDNSGVGSAAIWHANGHLIGMAGSLKATDLHALANGMVAAP